MNVDAEGILVEPSAEAEVGFDRSCIPPGRVFYLKIMDGRDDGLLDLDGELPEAFHSLSVAESSAIEDAECSAGESWIYECKAVRRIRYGEVVIEEIEPAPPRSPP